MLLKKLIKSFEKKFYFDKIDTFYKPLIEESNNLIKVFMKPSIFLNQIYYFEGYDDTLSTIGIFLIVGLLAFLFLLIFAYLNIKLNNQEN